MNKLVQRARADLARQAILQSADAAYQLGIGALLGCVAMAALLVALCR